MPGRVTRARPTLACVTPPPGPRRFHDDDLAALRDRVDLTDLIREHVDLKPSGADSFKGCCPFHDEKSPSFHVTPSKGVFHCFGCGEGGDAIKFRQLIEHVTFPEAVRSLAEQNGIELRDDGPTEETSTRAVALSVLTQTQAFYATQIATPAAADAVAELRSRGFTREHASDAGCGYAPDGVQPLLDWLGERGHTLDDAVTAGVVRPVQDGRPPRAMFRDRLTWPIRDTTGRVVGFGARRLSERDTGPKYLNSAEAAWFHKSELLYGWDVARKAAAKGGRVILVEGYTDVMAARASGLPETVATCGTAFGDAHARMLAKALPDDTRIVFALDGDSAGVKATLKAFTVARELLNRAFAVRIPAGEDPCAVFTRDGGDGVRALFADPVPLTRQVVDDALSGFDLDTPEGTSNAVSAVSALLSGIPDEAIRSGYQRYASDRLGVTVPLTPAAAPQPPKPPAPSAPHAQPDTEPAPRHPTPTPEGSGPSKALISLERRIIDFIVAAPSLAATVAWNEDRFVTPPARCVAAAAATVLAAGGVGGHSLAAWAGALIDAAPNQALAAAVVSAAAPVQATPALLDALLDRHEEAVLLHRVDEWKALLDHTPAGDVDALLDKIMQAQDQLAARAERDPGAASLDS